MTTVFSRRQGLEALTIMLRSRCFEQRLDELFGRKLMHGTTHLAIGQEAAHAGLAMGLESSDWIVPTHRCHGHTIARGTDPYAMFSEMFGSRDGCCKGLGGSMHMTDVAHCNAGSSAVVASGVPVATGMALAFKRNGSKAVSVAIFGDGASSRGAIHESMNLASVWRLPVLFFCENNGYGMSAPAERVLSVTTVSDRGPSYSMKSNSVDGNDVEAVYTAVKDACDHIRATSEPFLLEVHTYRQCGHSKNDARVYRTREEERRWLERCPIEQFKAKMIARNQLDEPQFVSLEKQVREEIIDASDLAFKHSADHISMEEASSYVYARQDIGAVGKSVPDTHSARLA
jgi:TPP-dependent pyruvate/acetoin dehydrogenase alpha subunit